MSDTETLKVYGDRAADYARLRAGIDCSLGEGKSHFSGAVIGDVAHRVKGFPSGACGNDNPHAFELTRVEYGAGALGNSSRLFHPARPDISAGLLALRRSDYLEFSRL